MSVSLHVQIFCMIMYMTPRLDVCNLLLSIIKYLQLANKKGYCRRRSSVKCLLRIILRVSKATAWSIGLTFFYFYFLILYRGELDVWVLLHGCALKLGFYYEST